MKSDREIPQAGFRDLVTRRRLNSSFFMLLAASLITFQLTSGQVQRERSADYNFPEDIDTRTTRQVTPAPQPRSIALEATIDPEKYYVGPSDVFSVNIWISPPVSFSLTVTPEGTLIIPTVGEIKVSDLTLAETKLRVLTEIRRKYISGEATVTLLAPRSVVVTVTGNVLFPGTLVLNSTDRVEKAIQEANRPEMTRREDVAAVQRSMSTRNISLKRKDATVHRVDLKKYYATKDDQLNPFLREGDIIFVPSTNLVKNVIAVYGEVNSPGRYEYVKGDSITDLIKLAYGFTRFAITDSVELSKLDETARILSTQLVNARALMEGRMANIPLEPGDRIVVKAKPELRQDYRATVVGEVLYPGTYPITKNKTYLSELVRRAGGFTEFAAIKSAELNRSSVSAAEIQTERLLSLRSGVSQEDSAYFYAETELRIRKEIVNVDFGKLFLENDSTQDVILQTEDYIVAPSVKKTIYVFGQVVSPGHTPYLPGEDLDYYVRKACGFTHRARTGDVRIVKAKTKQWLSPRQTAIEEGDYIWVPKEPDRTFSYYMTILSQAASVLSVAVGIAVVIVQVTK